MIRLKYYYLKQKEKFIIWFLSRIPDSWLYFAIIQAWARVTCKEYTNKTPDEVSWLMACKALENRSKKKNE